MNEQHFMIADLDPVIIIELATDEEIHRCVAVYRGPTNPSIAAVHQGMNIV